MTPHLSVFQRLLVTLLSSCVTAMVMQDWRQTLWSQIQTELMEDGAKNFVKEVKSLSKKVGRWCLLLASSVRALLDRQQEMLVDECPCPLSL